MDQETHQVTLVDAIEGIAVLDTESGNVDQPSEASFECEVTLLSFWVRSNPAEPERGEARISLWGPDGKPIESDTEIRLEIDLREKPQLRTQLKMNSLPLHGPGRYTFKVERSLDSGWETVARIPYELVIHSPEAELSAESSGPLTPSPPPAART
ncbi:MAG TPA: hypothetical protein VLQ45_19095 [Thermoanaerobaculia bacterium]|nr:hypothetical protein [Thermoanaerobaculia bacterium]